MFRTVIAAFAGILLATSAVAAPVIGQPAPDFSGTDALSGSTVSLAELKGKTVVLEWNNFDCPFVKKFYSSGTMQQMQSAAGDDEVVWITVNSSAAGKQGNFADAAAAKAALAEVKSNAQHYLLDTDGTIGRAYGAKTTPHMFVIRNDGTLVYNGAMDDKNTADTADLASAHNYVTAALASLKAGTAVKTATTQPYGCAVKYQ